MTKKTVKHKLIREGIKKGLKRIGKKTASTIFGRAAAMLSSQKAYAHQDGKWVTQKDGSKKFVKTKFYQEKKKKKVGRR